MSNKEKDSHLKKCLLTIGVNQLDLAAYMERSLEIDRKFQQQRAKLVEAERKLQKAQAELFTIFLTT
jgi:hypothetical protein